MDDVSTNLRVTVDRRFLPFFKRMDVLGDTLDKKVQVSLAISLFAEKQISLARAAELAEKSLIDFMEILKRFDIPWCEYTDEMAQMDDQALSMMISEEVDNEY